MNFLKRVLFAGILVIGFITIANTAEACEFKFKVEPEAKENYSIGEELVVKVTLVLTHRNCPEGLEATKWDFKGMKVIGATKWKELSEGTYERKFKLQLTDDNNKHIFSATRTCDKDGGAGSLTLSVK